VKVVVLEGAVEMKTPSSSRLMPRRTETEVARLDAVSLTTRPWLVR
jgi:hypothetical protein